MMPVMSSCQQDRQLDLNYYLMDLLHLQKQETEENTGKCLALVTSSYLNKLAYKFSP